jgi:ferritin-like metal-binding protein YciE
MKDLKNLNDLLANEVQLLYNTENYQLLGLPRMMKHTQSEELKQALQQHLEETKQQKQRLQRVGELLSIDPDDQGSPGIKGLLFEGEKFLHKDATPETCDAAIIAEVQKVEHYEISGYGTAAYLAEELGFHEVHELLGESLQEEKKTDEKLNELAKNTINRRAKHTHA